MKLYLQKNINKIPTEQNVNSHHTKSGDQLIILVNHTNTLIHIKKMNCFYSTSIR